MLRLRAEVQSDWSAFRSRVAALREFELHGEPSNPANLSHVATLLHHGFSALESALARVAKVLEGRVAEGSRWHESLLASMALDLPGVRPRILSPESLVALHRLLGFRHFFRHAYAVDLDPVRLEEIRQVAIRSEPVFEADFRKLDVLIESLARSD